MHIHREGVIGPGTRPMVGISPWHRDHKAKGRSSWRLPSLARRPTRPFTGATQTAPHRRRKCQSLLRGLGLEMGARRLPMRVGRQSVETYAASSREPRAAAWPSAWLRRLGRAYRGAFGKGRLGRSLCLGAMSSKQARTAVLLPANELSWASHKESGASLPGC